MKINPLLLIILIVILIIYQLNQIHSLNSKNEGLHFGIYHKQGGKITDYSDYYITKSPKIPKNLQKTQNFQKNENNLIKIQKNDEVSLLVSYGDYYKEMNKTGWNKLEIYTFTNPFSNETKSNNKLIQTFGLGLFEGYISSEEIINSIKSYKQNSFPHGYPPEVINFLHKMLNWIQKNLNNLEYKTGFQKTYWENINLIFYQLKGIHQGLLKSHLENKNNNYYVDFMDLFILNINGDFHGITPSLSLNNNNNNLSFQLKEILKRREKEPLDHCSGLIKLLKDGSNLYFAQTTWTGFSSMLRVAKKYHYCYNIGHDCVDITFSSYPGIIYSFDDWYSINKRFGIIETTVVIRDKSIYKQVTYEMIPTGIRLMSCNKLIQTSEEWSDCMRTYSSGVYPNEYYIVDYKYYNKNLFKSIFNNNNNNYNKKNLISDKLIHYYVEIPGIQKDYSLTQELLNKSYLGSYNIVRDKEIYNKTGCQKISHQYDGWFTFEKQPRGLIFKRDHNKIVDLESMKKIMRYNNYLHDKIQNNCPGNAISSRKDLIDPNLPPLNPYLKASCFGGIDAKIGDIETVLNNQMHCVSGPTNDQLPTFKWSNSNVCKMQNVVHYGQPNEFNFDWIIY